MDGLGITDPADVIATARLACLLKCGDDILEMGNSPNGLNDAIAQAEVYYSQQLVQPRPFRHCPRISSTS